MSNYYEKQSAKVKLSAILADHGFTIYGFREDQSDSMTDYWSPAHWEGVAERNGYVVVVDAWNAENSGGRKRVRYENGQHVPYVEPWPTYQANPSRANWHVEKDGVILAKGNGLVAADSDADKLQRIADRILAACAEPFAPTQVPQKEGATVDGVTVPTVTLNTERNGIEIRFLSKPAAGIIAMLKENGFRWSGRGFWYAKQTPERLTLANALAATDTTPDTDTADTADDLPPTFATVNVAELEQTDAYVTPSTASDTAKRVYITVKRVNSWADSFLVLDTAVTKRGDNGYSQYDHDAARAEIVARYPHLSTGDYAYKLANADYEYVPTSTPAASLPPDRIPMSRIVFTWSESHTIEGGEIFTRWSDANELIRRAEREHADKYGIGGGYFKTGFVVTWQDGYVYEGRIDINEKDNNLVEHIREWQEFCTGNHKPSHMTQEQYDNLITGPYAEYVETSREFLARYILGDDTPAPTPEQPTRTAAKVVNLFDKRADKLTTWTPVQKLMLHCLGTLLDADTISAALANGITVEKLFEVTANAAEVSRHVTQ